MEHDPHEPSVSISAELDQLRAGREAAHDEPPHRLSPAKAAALGDIAGKLPVRPAPGHQADSRPSEQVSEKPSAIAEPLAILVAQEGAIRIEKIVQAVLVDDAEEKKVRKRLQAAIELLVKNNQVVRLGSGYLCSTDYYERHGAIDRDSVLSALRIRPMQLQELYQALCDSSIVETADDSLIPELLVTLHKMRTTGEIVVIQTKGTKRPVYSLPQQSLLVTDLVDEHRPPAVDSERLESGTLITYSEGPPEYAATTPEMQLQHQQNEPPTHKKVSSVNKPKNRMGGKKI